MEEFHDHIMMRNIEHPDHRSGSREFSITAVLVAMLMVIGLVLYQDFIGPFPLPGIVTYLIIVFCALGCGLLVARWTRRAASRFRKMNPEKVRAANSAEKARQIKEARESGAFDRFEQ